MQGTDNKHVEYHIEVYLYHRNKNIIVQNFKNLNEVNAYFFLKWYVWNI